MTLKSPKGPSHSSKIGPSNSAEEVDSSREIAGRWCAARADRWTLGEQLGKGGTAPVFEVESPEGPRALKIYDAQFSTGETGVLERKRVEQQLALKNHECPSLVEIYEGGEYEGRLFLLMERAPGHELEKILSTLPRAHIRHVLDQVARAAMFLRDRGLCHRDIKSANIFVSDDFSRVTLLDISVIREIHDPLGIGTDHEDQLPVVATARYSPPEYLFRLLDPGSDLWHALNVYQLGALLHDLIMREPLFQSEYARSKENRYRFAWIVATSIPDVRATDVDQDLVLMARRALDKDWQRRSTVRLEDFLSTSKARKTQALRTLGFARPAQDAPEENLSATTARIAQLAQALDDAVVKYLRTNNITSKHRTDRFADDASVAITISWSNADPAINEVSAVQVRLTPRVKIQRGVRYLQITVELQSTVVGQTRSAALEIPEVEDTPASDELLCGQCIAAFEQLAIQITTADAVKE